MALKSLLDSFFGPDDACSQVFSMQFSVSSLSSILIDGKTSARAGLGAGTSARSIPREQVPGETVFDSKRC